MVDEGLDLTLAEQEEALTPILQQLVVVRRAASDRDSSLKFSIFVEKVLYSTHLLLGVSPWATYWGPIGNPPSDLSSQILSFALEQVPKGILHPVDRKEGRVYLFVDLGLRLVLCMSVCISSAHTEHSEWQHLHEYEEQLAFLLQGSVWEEWKNRPETEKNGLLPLLSQTAPGLENLDLTMCPAGMDFSSLCRQSPVSS
ncbi:hypothetical protein PENFLA_c011G08219 [Penicillium flavigenum]|uniref:Uncharacterized protein n=1 Tax=Penicillium flavigenum TaxID=254877 RepID=A0A1V6TB62_9EURO|nr:hypothetical protein PENFLA_c011G08219 [Penicillium flavigenum]